MSSEDTAVAVKTNTLHNLLTEYQDLMSRIVAAGGEITPDLEQVLNSVDLAVAHKIDSYGFVISKLEVEEQYWKARADELNRVAKAIKSARERMKEAIKSAMHAMRRKEVCGVDKRFVLTASAGRLVVDENLLPAEYKTQVVSWVPDKEKIKEDLNAFKEVPGASIEGGVGLRIYPNSKGDR